MYPYMNEDVAFERLKDMQREMENSRLLAAGAQRVLTVTAMFARRAWVLAGVAMQRAPRRRASAVKLAD